ncbi:hypothetical protein [Pelomonas cellulosilytica]|uniref:Uncharacterized protein n=1 Tax=Pelomonas cellulosilytica TaxID=2906762 RepID=A0ABS8XXX6_9BURK|nr:hypothetical protein [Pelomonas sp. P8]MCE4555584.1 hypothetical protein [Pelomonas sp. P8]
MFELLGRAPTRMSHEDAREWMDRLLEIPADELDVAGISFEQYVPVEGHRRMLTNSPPYQALQLTLQPQP